MLEVTASASEANLIHLCSRSSDLHRVRHGSAQGKTQWQGQANW